MTNIADIQPGWRGCRSVIGDRAKSSIGSTLATSGICRLPAASPESVMSRAAQRGSLRHAAMLAPALPGRRMNVDGISPRRCRGRVMNALHAVDTSEGLSRSRTVSALVSRIAAMRADGRVRCRGILPAGVKHVVRECRQLASMTPTRDIAL